MATSSLAGQCAPVLQLVHSSRLYSHETEQALREMADMAKNGEIIGLAYVVLRPHRHVTIGAVGVANQEPSLVTHWLEKLKFHFLK